MVEEPLSVAKLLSPKPSSGKEPAPWGATLRPKALFNYSRLCTSTIYNVQVYVRSVRVCCSHGAIIDRGIHAPLHWIYVHTVLQWTNYTATYITVHNQKNI